MSQLPLGALLEARAAAYAAVRSAMADAGAIEVITPILCTFGDLAPMPQFRTRHPNATTEYCLRIAPEEHLTRLVALGAPAVFELATNFRAETIDETHLIEFVSVEALFPGATVVDMRQLAERLFRDVLQALHCYQNAAASTSPLGPAPFQVVSLPDWLSSAKSVSRDSLFTDAGVRDTFRVVLGEEPASAASMPSMIDQIIGAIAATYSEPVFLSEFPHYLGGPASAAPGDDRFLDRSELYHLGIELGSVATQLSDPALLRDRYEQNRALKVELGIEPNEINLSLLEDLEHLGPYGGLGLGLDRLIQIALGIPDIRHSKTFVYE